MTHQDLAKFETDRIKALQEERLHIQKKTFTKWMNSFLSKAKMEVDDLFTDLADGKKLLKLLEIISGEKLGKINEGRMRVHRIENVNKSLAFLHTKVRLESIGAEDIVDGNPRLILGLVWTIILRFQIQEIEIEVNEEDETSEKKSAKEALLLWCQRRTAGYSAVRIADFTGSWRSGMGFNALIHYHRPDLINFSALNPDAHIDNLNNAFEVAHRDLGVSKLLDAEDIDTERPDEKSIMTYVSSLYHTFAKMKSELKGGRRIANIIAQLMELDRMQNSYEAFTSKLLSWIEAQILKLSDTNLPNTLDGIQKEMTRFKQYRTVEKPPKYTERSEIEALLFSIQTKNKALGQPPYTPPEGKLVQDIERAWTQLEKAEHKREVSLREEFLRLEKLENVAFRFTRKSVLREGYLKEMIQVLSDPRYGSNLAQVEATVKKHEAISADIFARSERFENLDVMAKELIEGNYHGKSKVVATKKEIGDRWQQLLGLLETHKKVLTTASSLMSSVREAETISEEIKEMEKTLTTPDENLGAHHLSAVEDLLQKQSLIDSQIASCGETIQRLNKQSKVFLSDTNNSICKEAPMLQTRLDKLNAEYGALIDLAKQRRGKLDELRKYFKFVEDYEEADAWIVERQRICQAVLPSKDLIGVISFQQKHKALEAEIKAYRNRITRVTDEGEALIATRHPQKGNVKSRIDVLQKQWDHLHELATLKRKQLVDAIDAFQWNNDANEAESWMKEKMQLVTSEDYGTDEPSAVALLQRHSHLESEIKAYGNDIQRLNDQSEEMIKSGIASLFMICGDAFSASTQQSPTAGETEEVPVEEWVEERVEREIYEDVVEEVKIPQIQVLYNFKGQNNVEVLKGERLQLNEKTNSDWWSVRKVLSKRFKDVFVPANYVKQIEDKTVQMQVKRPRKVVEIQRVKKVVMKKNKKPSKRSKRRLSIICDAESVEQRQRNIKCSYEELVESCRNRRQLLEDAICLFKFNRECDNFESWIKDREAQMLETHKQHQQQMYENQKQSVKAISDPIEILRKKFENFITDLSANKSRLAEIDKMASEFTSGRQQNYSQAIKQRQRSIHERWDKLNRLRHDLGKNVEGLTSVDMFNRTVDDAIEWMTEKRDKMEYDGSLTRDMKSIQALQRKHDNLERELAPIEEKLNTVNILADGVKAAFPAEKGNVAASQLKLKEMWESLKASAIEKRNRLDESLGFQVLKNSSLELLGWMRGYAKQALANSDTNSVRDVATAEMFLKQHEDLGFEIANKNDDFAQVQELGTKLMHQKPNEEVRTLLIDLTTERELLHKAWQEKDNWLKQCKDLMIFNQEADHIETFNKSHNTYLEFDDIGTTLDDVEALIKRHENFLATLNAQDERLQVFSEMADKLIYAKHYHAQNVDERRKQVIAKRSAVKEKALQRKQVLFDAMAYQEFKADADDFLGWCTAKMKTAMDDSYKDLTNVERKLQKHEVFEAEILSSQTRCVSLVGRGEHLIQIGHLHSKNIKDVLQTMNLQWEELCTRTTDRGKGLRQANAQVTFNRSLEHARSKLTELQRILASTELGKDLRGCKELIKRHQNVESDLAIWRSKMDEMVQMAEEMSMTHFDGVNILRATTEVSDGFNKLEEPARKRRSKLNESFKFHQFEFEINAELQWINDREPALKSSDVGHSLIDAQNLLKNHQKLTREIAGHQSQVDKAVANGETLVAQDHFAKGAIALKSKELTDCVKQLKEIALEKRKKLEASLRVQTFLNEANEIDSWLTDKANFLSNTDYGKNEDAAIKLLTKHKAVELEVDTYAGLVSEMKNQAQKLLVTKPPDEEKIIERTQLIENQLKNVQQLLTQRRTKLIESKNCHEYFREAENFQNWVTEQMQTALSDDYGTDYEHLLVLQSKFHDFKCRVESNSDRFNQCHEHAIKLRRTDLIKEIEARQLELKDSWSRLKEIMDARHNKLKAAGEIHRFNRDVAEALSRIQEKYSVISVEDLGKDMHSVQSLLRKHEGYENDLVALEAQLQVLIDDSARLQSQYPGGNADHILQQQEIVLHHWNTLQERAALRKEHLLASCALQKFIAAVRDLERWADTLGTEIGQQERVRDAVAAQALRIEHDRIKAEIETREPDFNHVVKMGELMINEEQHYAADEIKQQMRKMLSCREALHTAWQLKKVYLDQLNDLHCFLRDAKQLDQMSNQQEHFLTSTEIGDTVEQALSNIKKHEAFEKLLLSQDEKLLGLQQSGRKLIQQNHFDSETIKKRLDEVMARRAKVKEMSALRKHKLDQQRQVLSFERRAAETLTEINDKDSGATLDESNISEDLDQIQTMIRTHNGFERNLGTVREQVEILNKEAQRLVQLFPEVRDHITQQNSHVTDKWHALLMKSARKRHRLEQAETWQAYYNEWKKLMAWINELFTAITAEELAIEEVESAERQLTRHKERRTEIESRSETCEQFRIVGEDIINKGHLMAEEVREKVDSFTTALSNLHQTWSSRFQLYEQNVDIRKFKRDAAELEEWIESSMATLKDPNLGDSIARTEELIKVHEEFERKIVAHEEKFSMLKRVTLLERSFQQQKEAEEEMKRNEQAKIEQLNQMKKKEQKRIQEERKKEDERRNRSTQDVVVSKPTSEGTGFGFMRQLIGSKSVKRDDSLKLPPVEIEGLLDRKHEHQIGGKRAANRSWKVYYTVLCGQLLCFFKDKLAFMANVAAAPPVNILNAKASKAIDYTKRKHVFRLLLTDGTEYLFAANDEASLTEWLSKISFHASLPPSMQLMSLSEALANENAANSASSTPQPAQSEATATDGKAEVVSVSSSSPDTNRKRNGSLDKIQAKNSSNGRAAATVNGQSGNRAPARLPDDQQAPFTSRGPPPLPPPRTTTLSSDYISAPILQPPQQSSQALTRTASAQINNRRPITENDLDLYERQQPKAPAAADSNGLNGHRSTTNVRHSNSIQLRHPPQNGDGLVEQQVHVIPRNAQVMSTTVAPYASAKPANVNVMHVAPPPPPLPPSAPIRQSDFAIMQQHHLQHHQSAYVYNGESRFEIDSDNEDWDLSREQRVGYDYKYAQATQQSVMVARHMSLPPNARPSNNQLYANMPASQTEQHLRPPSQTASTSDDDVPVQKAAKKKGMMASLFKRNK